MITPEEFSEKMRSLRKAYGATEDTHKLQLECIYEVLEEQGFEEGLTYFCEIV